MRRPPPFPPPITGRNLSATTSSDRSTAVFKTSDVNNWIRAGGLNWAMFRHSHKLDDLREGFVYMNDIEEAYKDATEKIDSAKSAYNKTLQEFRATIKNDLASIASSSEKVKNESEKITRTCAAAIDLMNSPQMKEAICNAEKLAAALSTISAVRANKIAFAVLETSPIKES